MLNNFNYEIIITDIKIISNPMSNEQRQFNNAPKYVWDIEKLRKLAQKVKENEDELMKEKVAQKECYQI